MDYKIKIKDLPQELSSVAQFIGIERFVEFCEKFGGSTLYIPNKKSLFRSIRNEEIVLKYNGHNLKELSKEYELTEVHIKRIIRNRD